jgi:hypothetical protein
MKRVLCGVFAAYLTLWLSGCAGAPPRPDEDQLQHLQVRTYHLPLSRVFDASVDAAQQMNFTIDMANPDAGVMTATRQTKEKLAKITSTDEKGLPTWAKVAIIATGIIIIIGIVILLTSHDDDEKSNDKESSGKRDDHGTSSDRETHGKASRRGTVMLPGDGGHHADTVRVKYKDKKRREEEHRHHDRERVGTGFFYGFNEPDADIIIIGDNSPPSTEWRQYRVTVNFDNPSDSETLLRLSVQGARLEGNEVREAGPVYDPKFYDEFFANLDRSLRRLSPDSTER